MGRPKIRHLYDLKNILYDQEWVKKSPNLELYFMHRGAKKKNGLRYDVTIIPPLMLGKEFVKTKGNRNSDNFSELYTVIEGKAMIFMQKSSGKIVEDAVATTLRKGECLIEPTGYSVVTINPSKKILKIGNWVSEKNKNIYGEIEKMRGACYFYAKTGWVKNKNYKIIPKIRFGKPFKKIPENLEFLNG